ncbi:MAG: hypothetical protein EXR66_05340 [Dehalococcoidia bacterium]|nr:hypothetical protein [Dehalococcoidia bacterium]
MDLGILFFTILGLIFGGIVLQATFAAQQWRRSIAAGDMNVLREAVSNAMEAWRRQKPSRGFPPADWQALMSVAVVAMDQRRCRVSMLVTPDIRVVDNQRREVGRAIDVARRVTVRMAERVLYEVPHVRFEELQIDVYNSYVGADGESQSSCILVTRVDQPGAAAAPWDTGDDADILATWDTLEADANEFLDPDVDALIAPEAQAAVLAAEETLRRASR